MGDTEISWTHRPGTRGRTWNPTQGCSVLSEGCRNCYAMRLANRFSEDGWSKGLINPKNGKWNGVVRLAAHKLADPLKWRQPSTVFVNSMSDLFHEALTNEQIAAVFGVMAAVPRHTFQVLTKRAKRMREWFEWIARQAEDDGGAWTTCLRETCSWLDGGVRSRLVEDGIARDGTDREPWPLPNVWLGVSVENQQAAEERIPELLQTPAAVRFLSCEPLLGPVDLLHVGRPGAYHDYLTGERMTALVKDSTPRVDWVIAGCESGPGARPCSVEWLRTLRDQCASSGVAYFLKQSTRAESEVDGGPIVICGTGSKRKAAGVIELPYLDGIQHASFPEVTRG